MNILLIIDDISTTGGAERVCANLANAFSDMAFANSTNSNIVERGGGIGLKSSH